MGTIKYAITSPVGVDIPIKLLQTYFSNKLWSGKTYYSYNRAHVNEKQDGKIPEVYTGTDYKDVLTDDTIDALSFFVVNDEPKFDNHRWTCDVDIIFSCKLNKLYTSLTHRADETVLNDILEIMKKEPYGFKITGISRGIDNVYSGFKFDKSIVANMQPMFHVKISTELIYIQTATSC